MKQEDFDINIARLKTNIKTIKQEEAAQQNAELDKKQIEYLDREISNFILEKRIFCNGLFSMLFPINLFGNPMVERNIWFFQSQAEEMVLVLKVIESDQSINFEKIQTDYIDQMRKSKQQTKIDISDSRSTKFGVIYFFSAHHAMPGEGLCDFIIIFQIHNKIVFMDFNFPQKGYFFWKIAFCKLVSTIRREGEIEE